MPSSSSGTPSECWTFHVLLGVLVTTPTKPPKSKLRRLEMCRLGRHTLRRRSHRGESEDEGAGMRRRIPMPQNRSIRPGICAVSLARNRSIATESSTARLVEVLCNTHQGSERAALRPFEPVTAASAAASFESRRIAETAKSAPVRHTQHKQSVQAPLLPETVRLRIAGDHHAEGKSLNAIAGALNAEGVPTAKGGKWFASTIRHVVHSVEVDNELAMIRTRGSA